MKRAITLLILLISLLFFVACDNVASDNDTLAVTDENNKEVASDNDTLAVTDENNKEDEQLQLLYKTSDDKAATVDSALLQGNSEFAVNMFKALLEDEGDQNIFISPLSLSVALSMTMNGTEGDTFDGMLKALGFSDMTQEEINSSFLALLESLEHSDKDVFLTLANSIWLDPGYRPNIKQAFIDDVQKWYLSEVYDATSPDDVNAWIEENTSGKIKNVIK